MRTGSWWRRPFLKDCYQFASSRSSRRKVPGLGPHDYLLHRDRSNLYRKESAGCCRPLLYPSKHVPSMWPAAAKSYQRKPAPARRLSESERNWSIDRRKSSRSRSLRLTALPTCPWIATRDCWPSDELRVLCASPKLASQWMPSLSPTKTLVKPGIYGYLFIEWVLLNRVGPFALWVPLHSTGTSVVRWVEHLHAIPRPPLNRIGLTQVVADWAWA